MSPRIAFERGGADGGTPGGPAARARGAPGKRTLTQGLQLRRATPTAATPGAMHDAAARGVEGAGAPLPHGAEIQRAFGRHEISDARAQIGGAAADACAEMGAAAYAVGPELAFASPPDLRTAAHEAAHVVQQRAGVSLLGGVGADGDRYEQHADAVADRVANGGSAEDLLDQVAPDGRTAGGGSRAVQLIRFDQNGQVVQQGGIDTANTQQFQQGITWLMQQPGGQQIVAQIRTHLQQLRAQHAPQFTDREAIALSIVERAIDAVPFPHVLGGPQPGQATFRDLPRDERWRMFIDQAQWGNGPLAFDNQSSPGYYAAMMRSFDQFLDQGAAIPRMFNQAPQQVDAQTYHAMHDTVTEGAFTRDQGGGFQNLPQTWSGMGTNYPMAIAPQHNVDPQALAELRQEGIARLTPTQGAHNTPPALHAAFQQGVPPPLPFGQQHPPFPVEYGYQDFRGQPGGIERVGVSTNYAQGGAQAFTQQRLTGYYAEVAAIPAALQALTLPQLAQETQQINPILGGALNHNPGQRPQCEAICRKRRTVQAIARAVRALHVGHVFPDANGRLNTMLLLNRLLIEQDLSPSIVADTSVFGGRASLATLIADIEQGQNTFQHLVQQVNPAPAPQPFPPYQPQQQPPPQGGDAMDTS